MDAEKIAATMRRCDEALVTARRALERKERECDGLRLELASVRAALEESRANAARASEASQEALVRALMVTSESLRDVGRGGGGGGCDGRGKIDDATPRRLRRLQGAYDEDDDGGRDCRSGDRITRLGSIAAVVEGVGPVPVTPSPGKR
jgi:hypothetical protein